MAIPVCALRASTCSRLDAYEGELACPRMGEREWESKHVPACHHVKHMYGCTQVAVALSRTKEAAVVAHARDELGIDVDDAPSPTQVCAAHAIGARWTQQLPSVRTT